MSDDQAAFAGAADELAASGSVEQATATLRKQAQEPFPVFLFTANVIKDLLLDPASDFLALTGFTYVFYVVCLTVPLWVVNFTYLWGKLSRLQALGRMSLGTNWGKSAVAGAERAAMRLVERAFRRQIFLRFFGFLVGSLVPIVNLILLQSTIIYFAHYRHNKIVKSILVGLEVVGRIYQGGGNPMAVRRAAEHYVGQAAESIVRRADLSGRIGDRYGNVTRLATRYHVGKLEKHLVKTAEKSGGRALTRGVTQAIRASREGGAPPAGGGNPPRS
jgi:hypothetical protein